MQRKRFITLAVFAGVLVTIGAAVVILDRDSSDDVIMGKGDGAMVEVAEETELSVEDELTDLYAGAIVETETAEEEEYIQSLAEGEDDIKNADVEEMDATMYATMNVNLRAGTAVTTESLRLVNFAEEVSVTGITVDKQWYRVEDTEKGTGFIASNYISSTKPEQNTSTQQASASKANKRGAYEDVRLYFFV